jgi:hypothetical protein
MFIPTVTYPRVHASYLEGLVVTRREKPALYSVRAPDVLVRDLSFRTDLEFSWRIVNSAQRHLEYLYFPAYGGPTGLGFDSSRIPTNGLTD